jgi:hypothetical protein
MSDVEAGLASSSRVYISGREAAHLAGKTVTVEHLSPQLCGYAARKRDAAAFFGRFPQ